MDPRPSRSLVQKEGIYSVTGQIFLKFDKKNKLIKKLEDGFIIWWPSKDFPQTEDVSSM